MAVTVIIFMTAGALMAKALGMDKWILSTAQGVVRAFRVSTGVNPADLFSHISLAAESRTYAEVLASNWYLQMYFIGGGLCALLAGVFVLRASSTQLWQHHAMFVAFMILLLLPIALTTVTYSEIFAARSISYICLTALILLGTFSCYELMRVRTRGFASKTAQAFILLLVLMEGVIIPLFYGVKFLFNA